MSDGKQVTVMPPRAPRLPHDASISWDTHPKRLFVCMTITKIEHVHALYDTLEHFSRRCTTLFSDS